jgi:hypothetical protein
VFGVLEQLEALGLELLQVRQIRAAPESPPTTEPGAVDGLGSGSLRATPSPRGWITGSGCCQLTSSSSTVQRDS